MEPSRRFTTRDVMPGPHSVLVGGPFATLNLNISSHDVVRFSDSAPSLCSELSVQVHSMVFATPSSAVANRISIFPSLIHTLPHTARKTLVSSCD